MEAPGTASYADHGMTEMRLYDLRVTVERIEGRSVCGLEVGDYFDVTESNRIRIPEGKHFCMYALQSVLPLLPAKQRRLPDSKLQLSRLFDGCCNQSHSHHAAGELQSNEL